MEKYYAGWDGGGTSTTIECVDEKGNILLTAKAGPLNPNGNPPEKVAASVRDALQVMQSLPGGLGACAGLCISAAGISNTAMHAMLASLLTQNGYAGPFCLCGDHESALYGALGAKPGLILISGTGSICVGLNADGQTHRSGGRGHLIDDEGSGYAIGRDMLSAIVQADDGRMPATALRGSVFSALHVTSIDALITHIYQPDFGKQGIAALAPLCQQAADTGDAAAQAILDRAALQLFLLAVAVAKQLNVNPIPTVMAGSILHNVTAVRTSLLACFEESPLGFLPTAAQAGAAHGAALLAMEKCR